MAIPFWLSKVIIVLTFWEISTGVHFDDLLDRVRVSKSNDPEVRDFLKTVLRHHDDFRWIQGEVEKVRRAEKHNALRGLPPKYKRSYYGRLPTPYRHYSYRNYNQRPVNDVYPYDGEEEGDETPYYRNYRSPGIYRDFLNAHANFVSENEDIRHERKARSIEECAEKRETEGERLLKEKLMLRNILYNKASKMNRMYPASPNSKDTLLNYNGIEVVSNGEKGMLVAPGSKYEFRPENLKKRCVENNDDHEVIPLEHKSNTSVGAPLGEFYYSAPHDVLGMNQDVQAEQHDSNTTCKKYKKYARQTRAILDDLLNQRSRKARKQDNKSIKIKIFDDGRLVKDIKKGDEANSIVLTIRNDKTRLTDSPFKLANTAVNADATYNDNTLQKIDSILAHDEASLKLNRQLPTSIKVKKDNMALNDLMHDKDFMQIYKESEKDLSLNATNIQRKSIKDTGYGDSFKIKKSNESPLSFASPSIIQSDFNTKFDRSYKKGSYSGKIWTPLKRKYTKKVYPSDLLNGEDREMWDSTEKQNRLEDQTEPTSAAEQRELGKINNNFSTPGMDVVTTDKMLIVPFKKSAEVDEGEEDDEDRGYSRRFQVKESKDMIHDKFKVHQSSEPISKINNVESFRKALEDYDEPQEQIDDNRHDNPAKSSNEDENYEDPDVPGDSKLDIKRKNGEKDASFQTRRLQSLAGLRQNSKEKRGLTELFKMSNDEDYSEDKVDYFYDPKDKKYDKDEVKTSSLVGKLHKFSLRKNTRKATKRTNKRKMQKKDVGNVSKRINLFTNKFDSLEKRASRPYVNDAIDVKSPDDSEEPPDETLEPSGERDNSNSAGNELDIIEKTQAIILHITNPPKTGTTDDAESITSSGRGDYDESDDPSVKNNVHSDSGLIVKHFSKTGSIDNDDDVIADILKIVNNYKNKEKRKQRQHTKDDRVNRYLVNYDDDEDASFSHHSHTDKKAHPAGINMNSCHIKPGTDHFQKKEPAFAMPKTVHEGYIDVETMASSEDTLTAKKADYNFRRRLRENPMRFTPDNVESFKDIVELAPRVKRNALDDKDNEALETLITPLRGSRARRYKNYYYDPYMYAFPNYDAVAVKRAPPDAPTTLTPQTTTNTTSTTANNTLTTADRNITTEKSLLKSCHVEDESHNAEKYNKNKQKHRPSIFSKHKPDLSGDDVIDNRKTAKDKEKGEDLGREQKIREKNREKMISDQETLKQKEGEHLKNVLNGHVVLDIMQNFQNRLKENEKLYTRFGQAMGHKCAAEQVAIIDRFREDQSKKDIKHAQLMLHQVIVMMNKIVADQVHRKMCVILPPTTKDFLKRLTTVRGTAGKTLKVAEGYPLPQMYGKENNNDSPKAGEAQSDFLFNNRKEETTEEDPDLTMKKKINLIKKLLSKYNHMSENCQIKVEPVKDYLLEHLRMLENLYVQKKPELDACTVRPGLVQPCNESSTQPNGTTSMQPGANATTVAGNATVVTTPPTTSVTVEKPTNATVAASSAAPTGAPLPNTKRAYDVFDDTYNPILKRSEVNGKKLSEKYKRLVEAADSYRRKRQIEERLARLFGRKRENGKMVKDKNEDEETDISEIAFESPQVYSLDD